MSDSVRKATVLESLGRASGLAGGATSMALWLLFLSGPGGNLVAAAMAVLSLVALVAAWTGRPVVLLIAAAASLLPVGLYLLGTPSIYAGVGLGNLLCAAGGGLMLAARSGPGRKDEA